MNIGICGAHRTGKTTLAQALAAALAIPFIKTSVSQVFQKRGLDPAQPIDFGMRLAIQEEILNSAELIWQSAQQYYPRFISDRTPIDMMAYTLADIQGQTEVDTAQLSAYLARCWQLTNLFFSHLCVLPPAIPLVFEVGKAALNPAYIQHLHWLVLGLCHDPRTQGRIVLVPECLTALDDRVAFLCARL